MKIEDGIREFVNKKLQSSKKDKLFVTADEVINYWRARNWLKNDGKTIKSISAAVNVVNWHKSCGRSISPTSAKNRLETISKKREKKNKGIKAQKIISKPEKKYTEEELKSLFYDMASKLPGLIEKRTIYEKKFENFLKRTHQSYKVQTPVLIKVNNKFYVTYPDFIINENGKKTIIEIDGEYHNEKKQQQWDQIKESCWKEMGYDVIRMLNGDIDNFEKEECDYDDALAWEAKEVYTRTKIIRELRNGINYNGEIQ